MKKLFIYIQTVIIFLSGTSVSAETLDTGSWYEYNGYLAFNYSFSIKFPSDWVVRTSGDELQKFAPQKEDEKSYFDIREFEGQTYSQAIDYYKTEETEIVSAIDLIFSSKGDFVGKKVTYENNEKEFARTFIKRGSFIISLSNPEENEFKETVENIYDSFTFKDDWHQYIDFDSGYTFIFPSSLEMANLSDGVTISDPTHFDREVFSVFKYSDLTLEKAPKEAEGYNEDLISENESTFNENKAITGIYFDNTSEKSFSRIFLEKDGNSFALSDVNVESNFPRLDYYNGYVAEILKSFEFFDIEGEYEAYRHFSDVRDNHSNSKAINYLKERQIIDGYPDGKFRPNGEINRAELTKMIVATKTNPDSSKYSNCFLDVTDQWFASYICYAKEKGWVEGYSGNKFKPDQKINRAEALKIIMEVMVEEIMASETLKDASVLDVNPDEWYGKYFVYADNNNLLDKQHITDEKGKYYYYPNGNISRKEVAETIYRILKNF